MGSDWERYVIDSCYRSLYMSSRYRIKTAEAKIRRGERCVTCPPTLCHYHWNLELRYPEPNKRSWPLSLPFGCVVQWAKHSTFFTPLSLTLKSLLCRKSFQILAIIKQTKNMSGKSRRSNRFLVMLCRIGVTVPIRKLEFSGINYVCGGGGTVGDLP